MKRFQFCVSVFLAVCLVGTILIAKIPGVRAETAQNGVMLTFNSSLGNTTSGNFWLDATGKQIYPATVTKKSVDTIAREVIQGKWGNGEERKQKLTASGYDYSAVQKRVNELLR